MRISFVLYRVSHGAKYQFEQFETSLLPSRPSVHSLKSHPSPRTIPKRAAKRERTSEFLALQCRPRNVTDFREKARLVDAAGNSDVPLALPTVAVWEEETDDISDYSMYTLSPPSAVFRCKPGTLRSSLLTPGFRKAVLCLVMTRSELTQNSVSINTSM